MLLFDPTESRERTRLPQSVIDAGRPLKGLEATTGADLLLTPLEMPVKDLDDNPVAYNLLKKHIEAGILIQRKTGRDAVNSIPHYPAIEQRMLAWTIRPMLITVGQYGSTRDGNVNVDGQETKWSWNAYMAALDWWQLRGGYYQNLSRDGQLAGYLQLWLDRLSSEEWEEGTTKHIIANRMPKQVIGEPDWTSIVMSLGIGFGSDKAEWLKENFEGLGDFLTFFCDERYLPRLKELNSNGVGKSHFRKVQELLGMQSNAVLVRYLREEEKENDEQTIE